MIAQLGIGILGVIAIALTQHSSANYRRYACFFGLAAQPFWFFETWRAGQWGIFAVTVLYAGAWLLGLWQHWIAPHRARRRRRFA